MGMSGGSWICQKRPTGLKKRVIIETHNLALEGQVCHRATPDFPKTTCVKGTVCKPRPGEENMSGASYICQAKVTLHWLLKDMFATKPPLISLKLNVLKVLNVDLDQDKKECQEVHG